MKASAVVMMVITLVGYFGGFIWLLNTAFKKAAEHQKQR